MYFSLLHEKRCETDEKIACRIDESIFYLTQPTTMAISLLFNTTN